MTALSETKRYQVYPEYKDSGVEWVGDIPSTWQVKPTFALFDPHADKNIDGLETNVLSLSYGRIIQRDVDKNFGLLPESFNTYQIVNSGDIILRLTDLQNDKRSLRVGLAKQRGIITSAYLKLVAKSELDPRFGYRLLHSYDTTKVFYGMGGGLRQSMKFEDFRRLPILLPSMQEQTQIANFLDHETAKIDTLIEKQQQLINLLKEKRQAVISHAVTKGLNPEAPMKDSGVEWLGEVPEHWVVTPYKYLTNEVTVGIVVTPAKYYVDSGVKCLRSLNVAPNIVKDERWVYISEESNKALSKSRVSEGDIVVVRSGQTGTAAVIPKELDGSNCIDLVIVRRSEKICSTFACFQLNSDFARHQVVKGSEGAIQLHFNVEVAKALLVCLPPLAEQMEITAYLLETEQKFKELLNAAEMQISLLKERRTALISATVTGKIDVRNWQAPISEYQAMEQTA